MIFIILAIILYLIANMFMGTIPSVLVSGSLAAILTFLITRKSWETRVIQALPTDQRELFLDRTTKEASKIIVGYNESKLFYRTTYGDDGMRNLLFMAVLTGLTDNLSPEDRKQAIAWLKEASYNVLDKELIRRLDQTFCTNYKDYYVEFRSVHGEDLASSIPFKSIYKRSIKRIYLPAVKELNI